MEQDRNYQDRGLGFLLICLLLVLLFGYLVLQPFLNIFLMALVLATITYPVYRRIRVWTKERKSLSAFLSCLFVVFVIIFMVQSMSFEIFQNCWSFEVLCVCRVASVIESI